MRALLVLALATSCAIGCAIDRPALEAAHPANVAAPSGRLAGAPATLRPGVTSYALPAVRTTEPPEHHHHHAP